MATANPSTAYAGDLSPREAWDLLRREPDAQLVDVRTAAEWKFVGTPDLSPIGRKLHCLEWRCFPAMTPNPGFLAQLRAALSGKTDASVLLLCRSGGRSREAAETLTAAGFTRCFNIAGGFEGDLDADGHCGRQYGWKAAGLPWTQT